MCHEVRHVGRSAPAVRMAPHDYDQACPLQGLDYSKHLAALESPDPYLSPAALNQSHPDPNERPACSRQDDLESAARSDLRSLSALTPRG